MSATNGSNARLDRIEKLIQQSELANRKTHARASSAMRAWVAFAAKDDLRQERRSAGLDKKIGKLAAAQLITEEGLQELKKSHALTEEILRKFIASMLRPRNGH